MKYNEDYLKEVCENKNLEFVQICFKDLDKRRKCVEFVCKRHRDMGIQYKPVEKLDKTTKPCKYCNHSLLRINFQEEVANADERIEVIDKYINWDTPLHCRCKIHDYEWYGLPSVLLQGGGCVKCAGEKRWNSRGRITTDIFKNRMAEINPNIEIISEYRGSHNLIKCRCKIHNTQWESYACNIQNQTAKCPECAYNNQKTTKLLSNDEFVERIKDIAPHITPMSNYKGLYSTMFFYCNEHNFSFTSTPRCFLYKNGRGCPVCSQSTGERKMIRLLLEKERNISTQHIFEGCFYKNPLRFDAYDIDNNIAYEYQGQQHYRPVCFNGDEKKAEEEYQNCIIRDRIKKEFCLDNKISLVEIPYWDYECMDKYII